MKNLITTICFLGLLFAGSANAAVHYVSTDSSTIQDAVEAAVNGDTVIVKPGTYSGPDNCNINLKGKAVTVQSTDPEDLQTVNSTVIDCQGALSTRGFVFQSGETPDSKVAGFTIKNGNIFSGGAISCSNGSSPTISNCVLKDNSAVLGGAIECGNNNSRPLITRCTITANSTIVGGGAIYCTGASPTIESCIIAGNFAPRGGAIYSHNASQPVITNCTISANAASVFAGGIYCFGGSNLDISNCILWGNTAVSASEMMVGNGGAPASVSISYCDIQGLTAGVVVNSGSNVNWGQGNIDLDPMFVSPGQMDSSRVYTEGNYHLLQDSPCIDAGGPVFIVNAALTDTDIDGDPRLSGTTVDIGADEVTVVSSINATIKFKPKALNRKSKGKWILCSIDLEAGYNVADIDFDSVRLNNEVKPVRVKSSKHRKKLHVVFNRSQVQDLLADAGSSALLTITGSLQDGTTFQGQDTIKIAGRHHNKKHEKVCKK